MGELLLFTKLRGGFTVRAARTCAESSGAASWAPETGKKRIRKKAEKRIEGGNNREVMLDSVRSRESLPKNHPKEKEKFVSRVRSRRSEGLIIVFLWGHDT